MGDIETRMCKHCGQNAALSLWLEDRCFFCKEPMDKPATINLIERRPIFFPGSAVKMPGHVFNALFTYGKAKTVVQVSGHYRPIVPADLTGHPDNWTPPDGGIIEDVIIWVLMNHENGSKRRLLSPKMTDNLMNDETFTEELRTLLENDDGR